MFKIALKGIMAQKLRLVATGLAVTLGVAFMAGTLVLTDTIGKTFDDLFADVNDGTDAFVRAETTFSSTEFGDQRGRVDASLVETISSVDEVAVAEGFIQGYTQIVDKDGEPVGNPNFGAPTFGGNWNETDALNPFDIIAGAPPGSDDEVVIDKASADETGYEVGDSAAVLTKEGSIPVTVSGIATFGTADSPGGASYVLFTTEAAQLLVAEPDKFDAIGVTAAESVSEEAVRDAIASVTPSGVEVLTGTEITEEDQSEIAESLGFFNTFLVTFAVIALVVGSFIIYNTFSIIVAQRSRESALLRAVGASRRQVLGAVLVEALAVGVVASILGILVGVGVAGLLEAVLEAFGVDIPASGTVLEPATIVTSLVVGVLVSVLSAFFPARRAAKIAPVAAMRDVAFDTSGRSKVRTIVGLVVTAIGAASLLNGLFAGGDNALAQVGFGALVVFLGVAVLGPVIAGPLSRLLGSPLPRLKGVTGTLARENAMRNPKRTASTASALMIGVALVAFITILSSSTKASIENAVAENFTGDFVVESGSFGFGGLSPELARQLNELPEVGTAAGFRFAAAQIDGSVRGLAAGDPDLISELIDFEIVAGSLDDLDVDGLAVGEELAADKGWTVGDEVSVRFAETGEQTFTLATIYTNADLVGDYFVSIDAYEANVADQFDIRVYVTTAPGVEAAEAQTALESVASSFANAEVQDEASYVEAQSSFVDTLLGLVTALLALAILIALLGIANTLALSIFERTRELGLLRAVGMTRSQLRSMVRWESVIIALLGTGLGLAIGLFFGWAIVEALREEGFNTFDVPYLRLVVITIIAALAGVAAAILPARRAARLDVLTAVSTE